MKGESTLDKVCWSCTDQGVLQLYRQGVLELYRQGVLELDRSTDSRDEPEDGVSPEEAVYLDDTGVLAQGVKPRTGCVQCLAW